MFGEGDQTRTIALIAEGLTAVLAQVAELLKDVECLVRNERFARAWFIIATADEELGKCHLLLDCARLNVAKHQSCLNTISKAFYDHVDKYAYMRLWRMGHPENHPWWTVKDAFDAFNSDRVEFWTASSSFDEPPTEPDMPHNTYFSRELNLYIDVLPSGGWTSPPEEWARHKFDEINGEFELRNQTKTHWAAFDSLVRGRAMTNEALQIVNGIWRERYIGPKQQRVDLDSIWKKTATAVSGASHLRPEDVLVSPICFWPCYDALRANRRRVVFSE